MKYFIVMMFMFVSPVMAKDTLAEKLQQLEKTHGIIFNDIRYTKKSTKPSNDEIFWILRDNNNQLRTTNKNFIQDSEKKAIEELKQIMQIASGSRVGNGGDVLKCGSNMLVLDYYQAAKFGKNEFEIYPYGSNMEAVNSITQKLKHTFPKLGQSLEKFYLNFKTREKFNESVFWVPEEELINIKDEVLMSKIKDCVLVQAVIRLKTHRTIYFFNRNIMDNLKKSKSQLSWMLVHEWLWDYIDNANDLRDLNHYLHSRLFLDAKEEEIKEYLNKFGFKITNEDSFSYFLSEEEKTIDQINSFHTILSSIPSGYSREGTLGFQKLYKQMEKMKYVNTPEVNVAYDKVITNLKNLFANRVNELKKYGKNQLELKWIISCLNYFVYSNEMSLMGKFFLIKGQASVYSTEQLSKVSMAKVYLQKRSWRVGMVSGKKKIFEMFAIEEEKFSNDEITFQEYINHLFDIMNVRVPEQFQNL